MRKKPMTLAEIKERTGMEYLSEPPKSIPPGKVLVHNVAALGTNRVLGSGGFRAWLMDEPGQEHQEPCDCGWACLGPHFRTRRSTVSPGART